MTTEETRRAVCPESTIESGIRRARGSRLSAKVPGNANPNSPTTLVCESTIESANRRGFIKKTILATAAAAVGSTIVGSKLLPESTASKLPNSGCFCAVSICFGLIVDKANYCNGNNPYLCGMIVLGGGYCPPPSVIGSQRNNCTYVSCCGVLPPGNNLYGLDFTQTVKSA